MRKSFFKAITGFVSAVVMSVSTLVALPVSAFTGSYGNEWNSTIVAVTAINEEENSVYLTNGCAISQNEFHRYSGETFDLKYGDVIQVDCVMIQTLAVKQFNWGAVGEVPNIEYLGTAKDYYDIKELVVAEKNDEGSKVTFKDSDGETYMWDVHGNTYNNPVVAESWGYKIADPEFDPKLMKIGDKFECAVSTDKDYDYENEKLVDRNVVVMPVSVVEKDVTASNGHEYDPYVVTVTAISEDGNRVYVNNGCALGQDTFRKYSGETFDLKCGDVIRVNCNTIALTDPAQFCLYSDSSIEYLGTAKDYYDTKELVVADKNDAGFVTFKDSDGEIYMWDCHLNTYNNPAGLEYYGFKVSDPEFDPKLMEIGDKFECAVSTDEDYVGENRVDRNVVVIPVSVVEKAEVILGDANDDKNVAMSDLVMMQRYITKSVTLNNYANADLNNDGNVDVFDVIILKRKILYG